MTAVNIKILMVVKTCFSGLDAVGGREGVVVGGGGGDVVFCGGTFCSLAAVVSFSIFIFYYL